jgi:hypothetical protein
MAETVSENDNLSELYENLIVIGEQLLRLIKGSNWTSVYVRSRHPQIAVRILQTKSSFAILTWC